jgi:hypothetical protein
VQSGRQGNEEKCGSPVGAIPVIVLFQAAATAAQCLTESYNGVFFGICGEVPRRAISDNEKLQNAMIDIYSPLTLAKHWAIAAASIAGTLAELSPCCHGRFDGGFCKFKFSQ